MDYWLQKLYCVIGRHHWLYYASGRQRHCAHCSAHQLKEIRTRWVKI